MTSFLYRAGAGVPGDVTRINNTIIESATIDPDKAPTASGQAVTMYTNGLLQYISSGATAADFFGILTRMAPSIAGDTGQAYESGTPNQDTTQGVVVRGYVNVLCRQGTPVRNGAVYMRVTAAPNKDVGDLEATADGANSVLLPGVTWACSDKDADNVAEIRIL